MLTVWAHRRSRFIEVLRDEIMPESQQGNMECSGMEG
jgi:hypothetical protein